MAVHFFGPPVPEVRTQTIFWRVPGEVPEYDLVDVAIRKVHCYGACLAEKDPALATRVVDAPLGSDEQAAAAKTFKGAKLKCWYPGDNVKAPPANVSNASVAVGATNRGPPKVQYRLADGRQPVSGPTSLAVELPVVR